MRLAESIEHLQASGIQARGAVGDSDPVRAIEDALFEFDADEIVISTHPREPVELAGEEDGRAGARRSSTCRSRTWWSTWSGTGPRPGSLAAVRLPVLETERLRVRPLSADDAVAVQAVSGEPHPGWLEWTAATYGQLEALRQPPYGERAICLREGGELVGMVGVVPSMGPFAQLPGFGGAIGPADRLRPEVGLYWAVAPEHRRNGYATEAARAVIDHGFAELGLARIVATTERDNLASIAVMRRLGMRVEQNPLPEPHWFQVVGWLDAPVTSA